jgi:hypothetical protein
MPHSMKANDSFLGRSRLAVGQVQLGGVGE